MFRITWISLLTGATGHSLPIFTEQIASEEVLYLNKTFPELIHRIEKYEEPLVHTEPLAPLNIKGHRCSYGDLTFVAHPSPSPSTAETPKETPRETPKETSSSASSASSPLQEQSPQPQ
jgi:hypothetical protein